MEWIDIKDKLPGINEEVLCYSEEYEEIYISCHLGCGSFYNAYTDDLRAPQSDRPEWWMPLPKPPKVS